MAHVWRSLQARKLAPGMSVRSGDIVSVVTAVHVIGRDVWVTTRRVVGSSPAGVARSGWAQPWRVLHDAPLSHGGRPITDRAPHILARYGADDARVTVREFPPYMPGQGPRATHYATDYATLADVPKRAPREGWHVDIVPAQYAARAYVARPTR